MSRGHQCRVPMEAGRWTSSSLTSLGFPPHSLFSKFFNLPTRVSNPIPLRS